MQIARPAFLLAALLVLPQTGSASENYVCIVDQAAGLIWDKPAKNWSAEPLRGGHIFIVKKTTEYRGAQWTVANNGNPDNPVFFCKDGMSDIGTLYCTDTELTKGKVPVGGIFTLRKDKKSVVFMTSYIHVIPEVDAEPPSVAMGKCSAISG